MTDSTPSEREMQLQAEVVRLQQERDEARGHVVALQHARRKDAHEFADSLDIALGQKPSKRPWEQMVPLVAASVAEVERLTAQLAGVHLALAEANVERAAGVDEPLWSEQHRVRLLAADRDALAAQLAEARKELRHAGDYCARPAGVCFDPALAVSPGEPQ